MDLAGREVGKISRRIYPSQNQEYSCQKQFIRTNKILSIILFTQFFLGCHTACNISALQLKFSKAGQGCKYPNRPTIQIKRGVGGWNHLKLPVFLGVKGFCKLCASCLSACLSESCVAGVLRSWTNRERSVPAPVRFVRLILSLWELLGRGVRMEKVMKFWREGTEGKRGSEENWLEKLRISCLV